jgi:transposase
MRVVHRRCAGLDVHKDTVVACIRVEEKRKVRQEVRTFGTTTDQLFRLRDWLSAEGVTHAAMEATGVYWKPVWHVLEQELALTLANAAHVKNVPGRKTDVNDATWLADLHAHGLIRGSFVPPPEIAAIRDVTRTRKQCVHRRTQETQRLQKVLEDANIKLASVLSDVTGMSGRRILEAIVEGVTDPVALAQLADERVRASVDELANALRGTTTAHHRFMIRFHLQQIDAANAAIAELEKEAERLLQPFREIRDLLVTMDGVSETVAATVIAEIGVDMSRFPSAEHLTSWAGLCPRNDESAGKRRSTRIRKSANWLKTILVQAAWAAVRVKDSYYRALFVRLKARRGPKKAIVAVAASMLTAMYHMIRRRTPYKNLGADHFDQLDRESAKRRLVRRLERLGYTVDLSVAAA